MGTLGLRFARLALSLCAFGLSAKAFATTVEKLGLPQLVAAADAIVIGRARSAETVAVGRTLYTRYRIEVEQSLLGGATSEVTVVVPGGISTRGKHPIALVVPYTPAFVRDERVALFLARADGQFAGSFNVVGFNQGRIPLAAATAGGASTGLRAAGTPAVPTAGEPAAAFRAQLAPLIEARMAGRLRAPSEGPAIRAGAPASGGAPR